MEKYLLLSSAHPLQEGCRQGLVKKIKIKQKYWPSEKNQEKNDVSSTKIIVMLVNAKN
jgi:hypothetical protein